MDEPFAELGLLLGIFGPAASVSLALLAALFLVLRDKALFALAMVAAGSLLATFAPSFV